MDTKEAVKLAGRYLILLLLGTFNLKLFYLIFTPLTVYPAFWVVSAIDSSAKLLIGNIIVFGNFQAEIIAACVAGAAYYLLLILNLSTPMQPLQRVKSLVFAVFSFLILNIARIIIFIALLTSGYKYFGITHIFVWYFGSTILVVLIWFLNIWLFNIKNIPIYTDIKALFGEVSTEKIGIKRKPKTKK